MGGQCLAAMKLLTLALLLMLSLLGKYRRKRSYLSNSLVIFTNNYFANCHPIKYGKTGFKHEANFIKYSATILVS